MGFREGNFLEFLPHSGGFFLGGPVRDAMVTLGYGRITGRIGPTTDGLSLSRSFFPYISLCLSALAWLSALTRRSMSWTPGPGLGRLFALPTLEGAASAFRTH